MSNSIVSPKARIGKHVRIHDFVNIYGECDIGDECIIGAFVEIQPGTIIGRKVKISSHSFICDGVSIEDEVFIGHGVMFTNDRYPRSVFPDGTPVFASDTEVMATIVKRRAAIGSGSTILSGITIGQNSLVGAGSVVTRDVPPNTLVFGTPARIMRINRDNWNQRD